MEENNFGSGVSGFDEERLNKKAPRGRVKTGLEGFDKISAGGLLEGRTYLLSGNAGSGKSIFSAQFLYEGAKNFDSPGILVATEETPDNIRENMSNFGMDFKELEEENKLAIIDASAAKIGIPSDEKYVEVKPFDIRSLINEIIDVKEEINAERCTIDSITALAYNLENRSEIRTELLKLSATLGVLGLTTLMTSEAKGDSISRFDVEEFVTEGMIKLYYKRKNGARIRSIEIYKMRGSDHSNEVHPFDITEEGIKIHPGEEVYNF
ncbi:circadian clock protein KaiC [archaeon SCG-AAA382B04]|nr:circadian clock protein KaiC [archaeon SCG-AAA382B04]